LAIGDHIVAFDLPSLSVLWAKALDAFTCFGVLFVPSAACIIVHGELKISCVSLDGEVVWSAGGRDIFSGPLLIEGDQVLAEDFNGERYSFALDSRQNSGPDIQSFAQVGRCDGLQYPNATHGSRRPAQALALMTDYRTILKRVGFVWIAFGLVDIVFMIYSIARGQSYSSSFNLFTVAVGAFLVRGSLGATTLVVWLSAFALASFIGFLLTFPFLQPVELLLAEAKLNPGASTVAWLMTIAVLALLGWSYKQLRSTPVLEARKADGRSTAMPKIAIGLGIAFVAFLVTIISMTLHGAVGTKAVELARQKLGPGYKYSTQSFSSGGGHTSAIVAAYNNDEIKYVPVEWSE